MDIIAAFRWESSKDKSLSYLIIDEDFKKRVEPKIIKLNHLNFELFQKEAKEFIREFYSQIEMLYFQNKNNCSILIEYKIVGSGNMLVISN
ncbi:hypothetical protein [Legionella bozemanae]|uniref:Uncharacterized protein n=1 Tax=Legionella bozemanae TaxID=447 RepID=A0A0W0RQ14_LEGBO|nr:hypothetical protein [Legionella bozemanae]KTC73146.1 hypothetical protein Lboz_1792 [Legionella bozemanae]STP14089.1 Uncharacterised protein [Legionella bozemanae]